MNAAPEDTSLNLSPPSKANGASSLLGALGDPQTLTLIRPPSGWQPLDIPEIWKFRELFWIFAARDIKVRYKQTALGAAWALVQPLAFTIMGTLVFGRIAGASTDDVKPAFLFYLASQLPWMLFNTGLQTSAMSLVGAQNMIKKVYFPRLVLPASAVIVSLLDFFVQLGLLATVFLCLFLLHFYSPSVPRPYLPAQILLLPIAAAWAFMAAISVGLPLAALNVEYRDVRYVIPFVTQFMIFAAPVFWSVTQLTAGWRSVYALMPIAGPIDFFRWCVLDTPAHPVMWLIGFMTTILYLIAGLYYFRRTETSFADIV